MVQRELFGIEKCDKYLSCLSAHLKCPEYQSYINKNAATSLTSSTASNAPPASWVMHLLLSRDGLQIALLLFSEHMYFSDIVIIESVANRLSATKLQQTRDKGAHTAEVNPRNVTIMFLF